MRIDAIAAHSISDTRGRPTIEVTLSANALSATASVPSGKSTGSHEALELRDADDGIASAVANVNGEIAHSLVGQRFLPDELDTFLIELDGTPNKSRLGANAILAVSIAAERLSAILEDIPLWKAIAKRAGTMPSAPHLFVNMMNGGVHVHPAVALASPKHSAERGSAKEDKFPLPFQEYMLVVEGKTSIALPIAQKAFIKLGELLPKFNFGSNKLPMGDEGGYAPTFHTIEEPFKILAELVNEYPGTTIAIDAAASELYKDGAYTLLGKAYSADELAHLYENLVTQFPLSSIEDPFDENASGDFVRFTEEADGRILVVGDDLTCTNPKLITDAVKSKAVNAVLIKPNQIGTVKEAIEAVQATYAAGFKAIASHRSGETDDTFIADFAYGIGAHGIKAGGLGQKERLLKYDRLLAIEHEAETM